MRASRCPARRRCCRPKRHRSAPWLSSTTLNEAPLISRNFLELTLLISGVTTTDPASFNTGTRADNAGHTFVNGNREQANNFMLDGADANQVSDNLAAYQPSPDAIQEMRDYAKRLGRIRQFPGGRDQPGDQVRHEPVSWQPF